MNMLEKFKDKQLDAQSLKQLKGGQDVAQWWECVDETGHYRSIPVNYNQTIEQVLDDINADPHQNAIVGCESSPNGGW